jgi:signal transduction histidine kinase
VIYKESVADIKNVKLVSQLKDVEAVFDDERMKDVIINLIDNAIKFTSEGGRVEVKLTDDRHNALISVKDNGIGIKNSDLPKLFDKFYQD